MRFVFTPLSTLVAQEPFKNVLAKRFGDEL
jgi:hypothetical protein